MGDVTAQNYRFSLTQQTKSDKADGAVLKRPTNHSLPEDLVSAATNLAQEEENRKQLLSFCMDVTQRQIFFAGWVPLN